MMEAGLTLMSLVSPIRKQNKRINWLVQNHSTSVSERLGWCLAFLTLARGLPLQHIQSIRLCSKVSVKLERGMDNLFCLPTPSGTKIWPAWSLIHWEPEAQLFSLLIRVMLSVWCRILRVETCPDNDTRNCSLAGSHDIPERGCPLNFVQ